MLQLEERKLLETICVSFSVIRGTEIVSKTGLFDPHAHAASDEESRQSEALNLNWYEHKIPNQIH